MARSRTTLQAAARATTGRNSELGAISPVSETRGAFLNSAHRAWSDAGDALEGAAKGRFGAIPQPTCGLRNGHASALKPLARSSHAPKRDVAAWGDADEAGEAFAEDRSREPGARGEFLQRPRDARLLVEGGERSADARVTQPCEPTCRLLRLFRPIANQTRDDDIRQPRQNHRPAHARRRLSGAFFFGT